jgi:hypothetical protein
LLPSTSFSPEGIAALGHGGLWPHSSALASPVSLGNGKSVYADQTVANINFALSQGGSITGLVKDNATNKPVAGLEVYAYPSDPDGSYGDWMNVFSGCRRRSSDTVRHAARRSCQFRS